MSFGDGNLHEKLEKAEERANMYRRQLGGVSAARNREEMKARKLEAENDAITGIFARQADEPICEMGILDARFLERVRSFGIEVE